MLKNNEVVLAKDSTKWLLNNARTELGLDWRWTGAFLILNTSKQLFLTFNKGALCSLVHVHNVG